MTWEEWVNSSYNTDGFTIICSLDIGWTEEFYLIQGYDGMYVKDDTMTTYGCNGPLASDKIKDGYSYVQSV